MTIAVVSEDASVPAAPGDRGAATARAAWVAVGMFWLCMTVASLDRQVIAIAARAIQADLHLSDTQLGFIQGPAFAFCAAATGLPIGWLLDRRNRVTVAAVCFAVWSATTSMIGFAGSFATLAIARGGGAVGEAGLAPAALSIFPDCFRVRQIPRASALFLTAPFVGAGLGLFVGGMLLDGFTSALPGLPAWLRGFFPWQLVFLTVGCPGVVLAIVLKLVVRDPPRRQHAALALDASRPTAAGSGTAGLLALYILGMTALVLILFVQLAWLPMRLQRSFAISASAAGLVIGPSYIAAGLLGAGLSGWLASAVAGERVLARVIDIILVVSALLAGPFLLAVLSNDARLASMGFFAGALLLCTALTLAATPIQLLVPANGRARTLALSTVSFNVVGAGLGPLLPGIISDRMGAATANAIGAGMAIVTAGAAAVAVIAFASVRLAIRRRPPILLV